jgi:hypothetical protein
MGYCSSTLHTPKYVPEMLGEDEDFLQECSIELCPEDSCRNAHNQFPSTELIDHIALFTQDQIDKLKYIIEPRRDTDPTSQEIVA